MKLTDEDRKVLLHIARETIFATLNNVKYEPFSDSKVLQSHCGVFITLNKNEILRGYNGKFNADYELYKVVHDVAILAALQDNRFPPINLEELNEIDISISVLGTFRKVIDINDIELGIHGIYMIKNGRKGSFLPQLAIDNDWNLDEFLGHCAQDKMGLNWNDWKGSDLFMFESEDFWEKRND